MVVMACDSEDYRGSRGSAPQRTDVGLDAIQLVVIRVMSFNQLVVLARVCPDLEGLLGVVCRIRRYRAVILNMGVPIDHRYHCEYVGNADVAFLIVTAPYSDDTDTLHHACGI